MRDRYVWLGGALAATIGCSAPGRDSTAPRTHAQIPTISAITPSTGGVGGGTEVTITGTNYSAESRVTIGGVPPLSVWVANNTRIVAATAPHSAGSADVVVMVPDTSARLAGGFTYLPAPTISAIAPVSGPTQGGTTITITGSNFEAPSTITVGSLISNAVVVDALHATAVMPPHSAGLADVVFSTPNGSATLPGAFTYGQPPPDNSALKRALSARYLETFSEPVPSPAFYDNFACGGDHVTTTTWLNPNGQLATLLMLYTSRDGGVVTRQWTTTAIRPAGVFRVLVLLVGYSQTVTASGMGTWEAAQAQVNRDHADFAAARHYPAPIVRFDNTNVLIDAAEVADPRTLDGVSAALAAHGTSVAGYDFIVSVNVDPTRSEGGFATVGSTPAFIYVGNFSAWNAPLTSANYTSIAGALYHHEVAHHWGWPGTHDWESCPSATDLGFHFRVPPVLLGWEDSDGDGIPEILDPTPYGRDGQSPGLPARAERQMPSQGGLQRPVFQF